MRITSFISSAFHSEFRKNNGIEKDHIDHDEITYRIRSGEVLQIPQAERYSSKDWFHNILTMPNSSLMRRIRGVVLFNGIWSILVFMAQKYLGFRSIGPKCHALLGSALGLLLVFRTNTAYNRFWEGRKIWEKILTSLRDLSRFSVIYADVLGEAALQRILNLCCAYPIVLQEHLQGYKQTNRLHGLLSPSDLIAMDHMSNKPNFVISKLAKEIRLIREIGSSFTSRERQTMMTYIDRLSFSIGATERIVQTPVPLAYARHTSRFLSLFCFSAPIALVEELGLMVLPFMLFMTWSLFGILEIGMMIEEPFQKALNLEIFAETIRKDVVDLVTVTDVSPLTIQTEMFDMLPPNLNLNYSMPLIT